MKLFLACAAFLLVVAPLGASTVSDRGKVSFAKDGATKSEFRTVLNACYGANTKMCSWTGMQYAGNPAMICMNSDGFNTCMSAAGYNRDAHGAFHADFALTRSGSKVYVWKP
jgi:hypothetical protein